MLAAGIDGIKNKKNPPEPIEENIFKFSDEDAKKKGVGNMPENLRYAIKALQEDEVVKEALGDHICGQYIRAKKCEWDGYKTYVSKWEHDQYLEIY